MVQEIVRRAVLQGGAGVAALAATATLGGCESFFRKIAERPVRRNIATLDPNGTEMNDYRAAVQAMRALPAGDRRNWTRQAQIHNDHCPHGNWFFLPWHRAYLFYFEKICQELINKPGFGLPYWHWQASPQLPAAFWGSGNPLFNATRLIGPTSTSNSSFTGAGALQAVLNNTDFQLFASGASTAPRGGSGGFYGALEGSPHNYVHGSFVGGDMGSWMSPLDPIFWCHHAMVDCMWVQWNIRCANANTNDSNWLNYSYTPFCDATGAPVSITTAATILMPLLSYRYDDPLIGNGTCPSGAPPKPTGPDQKSRRESEMDRDTLQAFLERGAPSRLEARRRVSLGRGLTASAEKAAFVRSDVTAADLGPVLQGQERLLLNIADVKEPPGKDLFLRAFVNLPDAGAATPVETPHYAGSFAFFSDEHAGEHDARGVKFLVDVSETARSLQRQGLLGEREPITVTLVPVPIPGRRTDARSALSVGETLLVFSPIRAEAK